MVKKITIGPIDLKKINASLRKATGKAVQAGIGQQAETLKAWAAKRAFPPAMELYGLQQTPYLLPTLGAPTIVIEKAVQCGFTQGNAEFLLNFIMDNIRKRRVMRKFKRKGGKKQK